MKFVQASTDRIYQNETKPMVRILSSGIKLTTLMAEKLGLNLKGEPSERTINYATDPESGKNYLYKSDEGAVVGSNKCFVNSGLQGKMLAEAKAPHLNVKGGIEVVFAMDTEGVDGCEEDGDEGITYFGMTFETINKSDKAKEVTEDELAETTEEEL